VAPPPAIVHLIGYPASGKLTVAKALVEAAAARGQKFVRLDNHLTGDVILSVIDPGLNPIPGVVWERVEDVREVMYRAIVELSPPDWSFVVTNVVRAGDHPIEVRTVTRVHQLAAERGSRHLAVRVHCDREVLLERVTAADRFSRHKWTDPTGVARYLDDNDIVDLSDYDTIDVDTTHRTPEQSAAAILAELDARDAGVTP
jgi:chloramphenicol 3-O-phosphotransferase